MHTAGVSYSTGETAFKGQYTGQYRLNADSLLLRTDVLGSGIEHVNFFGFGNDTPNADKAFSRTEQDLVSFFPSLRFGSSSTFEAFVGPEAKWVSSPTDTDTILNQQDPLGAGRFGEVLVRGGFELDSRGRQTPFSGFRISPVTATQVKMPTSGVRAKAEGFYAPSTWDVEKAFGGIEGNLAGYVGGQRAVLALRVGGEKVWGDYPWFEAADIGGSSSVRGFSNRRFSGDASLYANGELRFWLGTRRTPLLPLRWGLFAFYDTGRVWVKGEDSDTWHYGYGGGLLGQLIGMPMTFNAALAVGDEGDLKFYLKYGYSF
jgi:outer membrane translocation and assembly module TamA